MAPQFTRLDRVNLRAQCNDGSPATFYWSPSQNGVWHIHLQGGGSCYDEDTCFSTNHDEAYMTSTLAPKEKIWMRGIFSRDSPSLALAHAGQAFIKYCSSDSWLGNSSRIWRGRPFFFHGAVILVEAVHALLDLGMKKANLVLFSGCSAGGRGAIYNMDGLCSLVRQHSPDVRCLGLGDSAWWMESVYLHGKELQSLLRKTAAQGHHVWGSSWISQPLWRCRQAQQLHHPSAGVPLSEFSPNISRFDRCMFGPTLAQHLTTPTLLAISMNDWFQFDHLSRSLHTVTFGGQQGGPVSQIDLQALEALRSEYQLTLNHWANEAPQAGPLRLVFASGCFGHCITEGPLYNSIRLREGPGKGLALSDVVASFVDGHYVHHQTWIEECHCATLSCSDGCPPRELWQVALTISCKFVLLPLVLLCGLAWLRRRKADQVEAEE